MAFQMKTKKFYYMVTKDTYEFQADSDEEARYLAESGEWTDTAYRVDIEEQFAVDEYGEYEVWNRDTEELS